ncbi:phosphoribosyltransferase [Candidatus Woesearchaeota archaeon]|nr:phosphoribosyltransferase [Candidatus Woesearchaeota archaeon]
MFQDRFDAGRQLASKLIKYKNKNAVILAIPRGALQVGYVLAKELKLKLDVVLSKKIPYPGDPEFAIGAVSLESEFVDRRVLETEGISELYFKEKVIELRELLKERNKKYHEQVKPIDIKGKIVIVVDDGIATGKTIMAIIELIKKAKPKKVVVAVPVAPEEAIESLKKLVNEVICLYIPESFYGIGQFYENFEQVEDEQAIKLFNEANK